MGAPLHGIPGPMTRSASLDMVQMKKGKKQKIRMLIGWEPTTYYQNGHFKFERIVGHAVAKNFEKNFEKAFEKAMAMMR